jgi:kynureninase
MTHAAAPTFGTGEGAALRLDREDPLAPFRERFERPGTPERPVAGYFCGNSLGLMPRAARTAVDVQIDRWSRLAVDGHFAGSPPWIDYPEEIAGPAARVVGARTDEVVPMNSLTVNLQLLMVSFYRPEGRRRKILVEHDAFPSDRYAVETHLRHRGLDPAEVVVVATPRPGQATLHTEDVLALIDDVGDELALVLMSGLHYYTGQLFDMEPITARAHARGALAGFDLAHAAGNVPLALHDWNVDFAAWCTYKYLNAGPGAVAGAFVHERHGQDPSVPRLAGWWGDDPAVRFEMDQVRSFAPRPGAAGWQLSNPPILALAPLAASLAIFDEAGMVALRTKSERLTAYLEYLIDETAGGGVEIVTPRDPAARGAQLSLLVRERCAEVFRALQADGFVVDQRKPDVIRVAPAPLYNGFHEVWSFARALAAALQGAGC